jgi:hypothetical protein
MLFIVDSLQIDATKDRVLHDEINREFFTIERVVKEFGKPQTWAST